MYYYAPNLHSLIIVVVLTTVSTTHQTLAQKPGRLAVIYGQFRGQKKREISSIKVSGPFFFLVMNFFGTRFFL